MDMQGQGFQAAVFQKAYHRVVSTTSRRETHIPNHSPCSPGSESDFKRSSASAIGWSVYSQIPQTSVSGVAEAEAWQLVLKLACFTNWSDVSKYGVAVDSSALDAGQGIHTYSVPHGGTGIPALVAGCRKSRVAKRVSVFEGPIILQRGPYCSRQQQL